MVTTKLSQEEREALEDKVWSLPRIQALKIDFDVIADMSDEELNDVLYQKIRERRAAKAAQLPKPVYPKPHRIGYHFAERDGKLIRIERWKHYGVGGSWIDEVEAPTGNRVKWGDKVVSSSIVLHYVRTGERLDRLPRLKKPHRAMLRVGGVVTHVGYYATREERDEALALARMGIFPDRVKSV